MGLDSRERVQERGTDPFERLKFIFLSVAFFLVIGGYTVAKELKDSIFISIVGKSYIPFAKLAAMFVLFPAIMIYAKMVDSLRRYQLLAFYSALFGAGGLMCAYFLGHPVIGLSNTQTSSDRIFGWFFYFFVEGYMPFVVSVFWAFANSVSSPDAAKRNYPYMVSASKIGGMVSAGLAWYLFSCNTDCAIGSYTDVKTHQIVLGVSSAFLMLVPVVIYLMMKKIPGKFLHGYEAVYQVEKEKQKEKQEKTGIWAGFFLLLKYPYVFGIFGMVYFYEVIATVLSYLRLGVAQSQAMNVSQVSAFLFEMVFIVHMVGFFMSFFGTSQLLKRLGERTCLMLVPLLSGVLLLYLMIATGPKAIVSAWIALKAVNYAFAWPIRESLYIPTVKAIKFKSKSWIDAFGSKFAKSSGSAFNILASHLGAAFIIPAYSFLFSGIVTMWFIVALLLGNRFERAVASNEVIGLDEES